MWTQDASGNWVDDGSDPGGNGNAPAPAGVNNPPSYNAAGATTSGFPGIQTGGPGGTPATPVPSTSPGPFGTGNGSYGSASQPSGPAPGPGYGWNATSGQWQLLPTGSPTPPPTTTPPPGDNSTVGPFTGTFTAPDQIPLPALPTYTPPPAFSFNAPTAADALNDPGYQFRVQQGDQGLQAWAAANGTLNGSGTAKALEDYNQNDASQEYANIWNRDWTQQTGTYQTNYQTQYVDPYNFGITAYNAAAPNILHENDQNYSNAWNQFLNSENMWQYNTTNALSA